MTQPLETLLGGTQEDIGFTRWRIDGQAEVLSTIYSVMHENAKENMLTEDTLSFGDIEIRLTDDGVPYVFNLRTEQTMRFSPWSFSQISEKLGMGATGYLKKCLQVGMNDLVPENLNRWITKNASKQIMIRTHHEAENDITRLRAIVSDRYGLFDHTDVVDCITNVLGESTNLRAESMIFTPDKMTLRLVDPTKVIMPESDRGYGSYVGMNIRNGQTGQVSVEAEFLIYTVVCTNGMFVGEDRGKVFYRKHYGITREDFSRDFRTAIDRFPEYIMAAHRTIEDARAVRLGSVFELHNGLKEFVQKITNVSDDEYSAIESIMMADWDDTLWGLSSAITQYAQSVSNSDRQYKLERLAGAVISGGMRMVA